MPYLLDIITRYFLKRQCDPETRGREEMVSELTDDPNVKISIKVV